MDDDEFKSEADFYMSVKGKALSIGQNLFNALRYLRADGYCRIWANVVGINQGDETEKSPQVSMMGNIFMHASSVMAWLGRLGGEDPDLKDEAAHVALECVRAD